MFLCAYNRCCGNCPINFSEKFQNYSVLKNKSSSIFAPLAGKKKGFGKKKKKPSSPVLESSYKKCTSNLFAC